MVDIANLQNNNHINHESIEHNPVSNLTLKPTMVGNWLKILLHTNSKCQKTGFVHMPLYKWLSYES